MHWVGKGGEPKHCKFKIAKCLRKDQEKEEKIDMEISRELHGEHRPESKKYRQKNAQTWLTCSYWNMSRAGKHFPVLRDEQNSSGCPQALNTWQENFHTSFCHLLLLLAHRR